MSMDKVLPLLIEGAETARDRQAQALAQAQRAIAAAHATLQRLTDFRAGCIARSPAATLARADGESLSAHHLFLGRLDQAIAVQHEEIAACEREAQAQHAKLLACQQRVLALDTLRQRRLRERETRAGRKAQRDADEFAARALLRARQEATP